jgi:hypothetical protein
MTFGELAELYLERWSKGHKRSWRQDEYKIGHDLFPVWDNRRAVDITRNDVIALLDAVKDRGAGVLANRLQSLISTIYNFGRDECQDLVKLDSTQRSR